MHNMSQRSVHTGSRSGESRRNAFLDTATAVVARRGFEAPTMEDPALARVDLWKSRIYEVSSSSGQ